MKTHIENLLAKYFAGEATPDEIKKVNEYKKRHPQSFEVYKKAYNLNVFENHSFNKNTIQIVKDNKSQIYHVNKKVHWLWYAAATMMIFLALGIILHLQTLKTTIINHTANLKEVILPDGSKAILDKEATLSYQKNFWGEFKRKVTMQGRIFFHVTKKKGTKFQVKTDNLTVTVLGTMFTVNQLKEHTQIYLTEGKVKVNLNTPQPIILDKSGEQVIVSKENKLIKHNRINASLYASWKTNKISFNNCTVKDVLDFLNDSYGIEAHVEDPSVLNHKLFGSAPADDAQLILDAISHIVNSQIEINQQF